MSEAITCDCCGKIIPELGRYYKLRLIDNGPPPYFLFSLENRDFCWECGKAIEEAINKRQKIVK